ncbi:DUF502 domain-containing protein [Halorarius litoreus]|uniref:DUF502 domain-containing protein n=1 Tax=Halorarius litoreus TaxID=2962676 RepID=UPI0020CDD216|nr:DUF502 domain-containing protein [Halorarius litoreus]
MLPSSWKRDFASGLIVLGPILVVAFVVAYVYTAILSIGVLAQVFPQDTPQPVIVLVTMVIFVLLVLSVGYLMRTTVGDIVERTLDDLFNHLPGLRIVYNASKMAAETALSGTEDLQAPVKLETWNGMRMTAFKTGKSTKDGRDVLFLPTAPNITTGFVIEVDPGNYEKTDETVEDALTRILSAGFGESRDQSIPINITEEGDSVVATDDDD